MSPFTGSNTVLLLVLGGVVVLTIAALGLAVIAFVLRRRNAARARTWARLEARWTPLLLGMLDGERTPDEIHAAVSSRERLWFVGFVADWANRLRGQEWETLRELLRPYLPDVAQSIGGRDAERRARAVQTLGEFGLPDFEDEVVAALDDESPLVAMVAARQLFRPENERYFDSVLSRLHRFSIWSGGFLSGMLAAGGPLAIPRLHEILRDPDRGSFEKTAVLDALRILNDSSSAEIAAELVATTTDRSIRVSGLRLLEVAGHGEHAGIVRAVLEIDDSPTRQAAAETLGQIGNDLDGPVLYDLLEDPSPWVRVGAARGLAALGAREFLLNAAERDGPEGEVAREVLAS